MPKSAWLGYASSGLMVALAAGMVAVAVPGTALVAGATALGLGGVLGVIGLLTTNGIGAGTPPVPGPDGVKHDRSWLNLMNKAAVLIGLGAGVVATALGCGAVAMAGGPAAPFAWGATVLATACVALLGWGVAKMPNPLNR